MNNRKNEKSSILARYINKHNMLLLYKRRKKKNEIQLTKKKMGLNNRNNETPSTLPRTDYHTYTARFDFFANFFLTRG